MVIGDISRLARLPQSINQKSGLYCTYFLNSEVNILTFKEIQNLAKNPREYTENCDELIDISSYDSLNESNTNNFQSLNINQNGNSLTIKKLNEEEFNNIVEILPDCIKNFVKEYDGESSFYKKRFDMILFLKEYGLDLEMITNFLYTLMYEKKFKKVMQEERIDKIYNKEFASPACNTLKIDFECVYCDLFPNPIKRVIEKL